MIGWWALVSILFSNQWEGAVSESLNTPQCVYVCVYVCVCMYVCVCVCVYIYSKNKSDHCEIM